MTRAVPSPRLEGHRALSAAGGVLMALALSGCPGEIDPSLLNMQPPSCNVQQIFTAYSCNAAGCHDSSGTTGGGFKMAPAGWEAALVGGNPVAGAATMCMTNGPYLDPGSNPATGLFLRKISNAPGCGVRMPQIAPNGYLKPAEITCVQNWANGLTGGGGGASDGGGGQ